MAMTNEVNSYQYCGRATARIARSWIKREYDTRREIPWTPLSKPLSECTVAFISSAGIAMLDDVPFDQEGERQNPWWGDPSYRVIPSTATEKDVGVYHLHINPEFAKQDLNSVLPLQRLDALVAEGVVGRSADEHYSFMGYILDEEELLQKSVPQIIAGLQNQGVDAVILVPV
jgi:D-proline reductase (dithiol) PrdB